MPTISESDTLIRLQQSTWARKRAYIPASFPAASSSSASSSSSSSTVSASTTPAISDSEADDDEIEIDVVTCDDDENDKKRRRRCIDEAAVERCRHFAYTDILLRPHLLSALKGIEEDEEEDSTSANPLLEFCLEGGYKVARPTRNEVLPPILSCCAPAKSNNINNNNNNSFNLERLEDLMRLCRTQGCDINAKSSKGGYSAMHFLIRGCTKDNFYYTLQGIYALISSGFNHKAVDDKGDSIITCLRHMLAKSLFSEAVMIVGALHQSGGFNINHVNSRNRSLLSYSVSYGQASMHLTRLLLNLGADVCPVRATSAVNVVEEVTKERESSAFTSFLKAAMKKAKANLGNDPTIYLLGQAMGSEPDWMKAHVTRVMLHLGHSYRAMGPLYAEVRRILAPYWSQPQPLKYLCLKQIRQAIGPKNNIPATVVNLDLPSPILQYLQLAPP